MIYHVIREDGVKVEGLTKEQVYELINGTTGEIPKGVDEAFITKLKELNEGGNVSFWVGTNAEYNAIEAKDDNTVYVVIDDTFFEDLDDAMAGIEARIDTLQNEFTNELQDIVDWIDHVNGELES